MPGGPALVLGGGGQMGAHEVGMLRAPGPLEGALAAAYGPVIAWTMQRLAARAAWRRG